MSPGRRDGREEYGQAGRAAAGSAGAATAAVDEVETPAAEPGAEDVAADSDAVRDLCDAALSTECAPTVPMAPTVAAGRYPS
ncbi:hypothetical protein [Antrihabitans spumae]|uniref:Uncharacterized protein n=1 Tax=Antrihabitans spumae TaxID=3373370 RepID=A0ABW7KD51_9NOCA